MKLAISSTGKTLEAEIDVRFGRCPYFLIVELENNEIKETKAIENTASAQAGGAGITASQLVADQKVDAIITVNAGPRAFSALSQLGIKIYQAQGKIKAAIQRFIANELTEISSATGPMHAGLKDQ